MNVFVSYTVTDEDAARQITRVLRGSGFDAWRDVDGIRMRESHKARILGALKRADALVVLLSPRALYRPWIRAEAHAGRSFGATIVAVRLLPCAVPDWLTPARVIDRFDAPRRLLGPRPASVVDRLGPERAGDQELIAYLQRLSRRSGADRMAGTADRRHTPRASIVDRRAQEG